MPIMMDQLKFVLTARMSCIVFETRGGLVGKSVVGKTRSVNQLQIATFGSR
jgi:hypothetical protein